MKIGLIFSTEVFYIYKGTTSNNHVCTKLKEHLHCSSWITIWDEPYRVASMDEPNFVHTFFQIDHNNLFENVYSWIRAFRYWYCLLMNEFKQTLEWSENKQELLEFGNNGLFQ